MSNRPKVLVNATTLVVGGGVQVGISLIEFLSSSAFESWEFKFAISKNIYNSLTEALQSDVRVSYWEASPASLLGGANSRKRLRRLEKEFDPDIIYSLGFPSYVKFRNPEIGRYTNPWEIFPAKAAWSTLPVKDKIKTQLRIWYRLYWAKRAEFFETQTEDAKLAIMKVMRVSDDRVKVIPNGPNSIFINEGRSVEPIGNELTSVRVLCLGAPYRHKNHLIIPDIAAALKQMDPSRQYEFIITADQANPVIQEVNAKSARLGVSNMIVNIGAIKLSACVEQYRQSHVVLLPTLLEVFSATYVEAMAMKRPIVTTDFDFAREVCRDAAVYFNPFSYKEAAEVILGVVSNEELRNNLIENGSKRLSDFPSPKEKYELLIRWLNDILNHNSVDTDRLMN